MTTWVICDNFSVTSDLPPSPVETHVASVGAPDPDDPRLETEPGAWEELQATFKWEDQAPDGEDIGPLIVYDPQSNTVVWETPEWVRLSDARTLAAAKGWQFGTDGGSNCD